MHMLSDFEVSKCLNVVSCDRVALIVPRGQIYGICRDGKNILTYALRGNNS